MPSYDNPKMTGERILEPRTPFKRMIDAIHACMQNKGVGSEREIKVSELDVLITNVNYYKGKFFDDLIECIDFGELASNPNVGLTRNQVEDACRDALCIVDPSAPMKLGNYTPEYIKTEQFIKEWAIPRSVKRKRNSKRTDESLRILLGEKRGVFDSLENLRKSGLGQFIDEGAFDRLIARIGDESDFYNGLRARGDESVVNGYRQLLPLWIAVGASPLYDLFIWSDPEAIETVCQAICEGFKDYPKSFQASVGISSRMRQQFAEETIALSYQLADLPVECSDDCADYSSNTPIRSLYETIYQDELDLNYDFYSCESFPKAAKLKAKLIWNVCWCPIFGPAQAANWKEVYTKPRKPSSEPLILVDDTLQEGCGVVNIRRVFEKGSPEAALEINLGNPDAETGVHMEGLVAVIGRSQTPECDVKLQFSGEENRKLFDLTIEGCRHSPADYYATNTDADSSWHVGFVFCGTPKRLFLVDLGSANGTRVYRTGKNGKRQVFVLGGRGSTDAKVQSMRQGLIEEGYEPDNISAVGYVELRRNDGIQLAESQFIVL